MSELGVLRNVAIFRELDDAELAAVWELISVREIAPKTRLVEEGKPVVELYIVTDGAVHVRRQAGQRQMLLTRLGPGGIFGEVSLYDPGLATATVIAMKPTQVAALGHAPLLAFFKTNPVPATRSSRR